MAELVRRLTKDPKNPGSTPVGVDFGILCIRGEAKSTPVGATGVPEGPEVDSVSQQLTSPAGEHEPQLGATRSCLASSELDLNFPV